MSIEDEKLFYDTNRYYYRDENYTVANEESRQTSTESSEEFSSENSENSYKVEEKVTPVKYYLFHYSQGQTKTYNSIIFADNPSDIERLRDKKIWSNVIIYNARDKKTNVTLELYMYKITKDNKELLESVSKDMKTIAPESFQTFHVEWRNKKDSTEKESLKCLCFLLCIETMDNKIVHIPQGETISLNIK